MGNRHGSEDGFTIVEVLIAAVLLVGGLLATLALLDNGIGTTATTKQRDVANAIAQEMLERATGGRNTLSVTTNQTTGVTSAAYRNDMTDVDAGPSGPADRLRLQMDPDGDQSSTQITPATPAPVINGVPLNQPQSWALTRKGTAYTVTYTACTNSDAISGITFLGPFDCQRVSTNPPSSCTATSCNNGNSADGGCNLAVGNATQSGGQVTGLQFQILGNTSLNLCAGQLAQGFATQVCNLLGSSSFLNGLGGALAANQSGSLITSLGNVLTQVNTGVGASISCPKTEIGQAITQNYTSIASSTKVAVTVAWKDQRGANHSITQSTLVRRQESA